MTLIAEMRSCRSQAFCIGVSPDGAQVRLRTGWSMKPLSSKKASGVSVSRAPFLFAANPAFATAAWHRRPTLALAARVSGWSSRDCEESSKRDTGGSEPETVWRPPSRLPHRSKARCDSRPSEVLPKVIFSTFRFWEIIVHARISDRDSAWISMHRGHAIAYRTPPTLHRRLGNVQNFHHIADCPAFQQESSREPTASFQLGCASLLSHELLYAWPQHAVHLLGKRQSFSFL